MPDTIEFASCEEVDQFFREGRPYFNELYVKKLATMSLYWNRVETKSWPLNSTTNQVGFRFGRGWYDEGQPWRTINTERCENDSCATKFEIIKRPGTDSYEWALLRREMRTDWLCVEGLLYKLFPGEEVLQLEETNAIISKHVHEEFLRSQYLGAAQYKWIAFADTADAYCGGAEMDGWYLKAFDGPDEAGYDLNYVYVRSNDADLEKIAFQSLDLLDDTLIHLQDEDSAYRIDIGQVSGRGPVLDVMIPDSRVGRQLYYQAKNSGGWFYSEAGFNQNLSELSLYIKHIIGDYALTYDIDVPRYNVDVAYNALLPTFNPEDRTTWRRLVRVPRYVLAAAEIGCKYVPNEDYYKADFSFSLVWIPDAIVKWMMPAATGYGNAQMATQDYAGAWNWRRPDWECNPFMKQGFFEAQHRIGAQIVDPTLIHATLIRLDNRRNFRAACCPLNLSYTSAVNPDCYNCENVGA